MTKPIVLADRLVIISQNTYVLIADDYPEMLKDNRVTVVPIPLLGSWIELAQLRKLELAVGDVCVRDPDDPTGYVSPQEASIHSSRAQGRLLLRICQHLGATSLTVRQSSSRSDESRLHNVFRAGTKASATRPTTPDSADQQANRGLAAELSREIRTYIDNAVEIASNWQGSPPDIDAAERELREFPGHVDSEIRSLIELRRSTSNWIDSFQLHLDFFSELRRHFALLAEIAEKLEVGIGKQSMSASASVSNILEWNRLLAEHAQLAIDVSFAPRGHIGGAPSR